MKKVLIILIFAVFLGQYAQAQVSAQHIQHTIHGELLGRSNGYGIGYDCRFVKNDSTKNSFGMGATVGYSNDGVTLNSNTLSVQSYYCYGRKSSKLEMGIGFRRLFWDEYLKGGAGENVRVSLLPYIGYRYQPNRGGLFFRAYWSVLDIPVYSTFGMNWYAGLPGLSLGYTFKPKPKL